MKPKYKIWPICQCGCGKPTSRYISSDGKSRRFRKFAIGHRPKNGLKKIELVCDGCGNKFLRAPAHINGERVTCCSFECVHIALKKTGYRPKRIIDGDRLDEMRDCYENTALPIHKIASRFSASRDVVQRRAKEFGWKRKFSRPSSTRKSYRDAAEIKVGRKLRPYEQVHHVNGLISDNGDKNIHVYPDAKSHSQGHKSLERCGLELMNKGLIYFCHRSGRYKLTA